MIRRMRAWLWRTPEGQATWLLVALCSLVMWSVIGLAHALAAPMPKTPPYTAVLTNDFGQHSLRDGIGTLDFTQSMMRPVVFLNVERPFLGMGLNGEVQATGWVTSSQGMTLTAAVDDVSRDSLVLTMPCVIEPPIGAPVVVSGTIGSVVCPPEQSGCTLGAAITVLNGNTCP